MITSMFETYLKDVKFEDWDFNVRMDGDRPYLQIGFWDYDATQPVAAKSEKLYQTGRKWMLSPHMTKSEVVQTAFKAVMTAMEHEVREKFFYKERAIFGPHFNIDVLHAACGQKETKEFRAAPQKQLSALKEEAFA